MRQGPCGEYLIRVSEFKIKLGFAGNFRKYAIERERKTQATTNEKMLYLLMSLPYQLLM